jgi:hypothetical protein
MAPPVSWRCPYCQHHATITDDNRASDHTHFEKGNGLGAQMVIWSVVTCPNANCKKYTFEVFIRDAKYTGSGSWTYGAIRHNWKLLPAADMKVLPDYVPEAVLADYKEACQIADLSPKASATLARRTLQGMIRDFWKVKPGRLVDEIKAIEDKVDGDVWKAIESVRKVGNIGAHMEADINVIVDVDPDEAKLLIGLIETLVDDWYVARNAREERLKALADLAVAKAAAKKPNATANS